MDLDDNQTAFDSFSSYNQILETIINQIHLNKIHTGEKSMTVYIGIDYNSTDLRSYQIEDLLNTLHKLLESQFSVLSSSTKIIFSVLYGIIIFFGIVSNALMVYTFYRAEKLRTIHNIFIINLAISDILLCCICAPLTLFKYIEINWYLGRLFCKLGPGLQNTNVLVTAFGIVTIAIDRWKVIVRSKDKPKKLCSFVCILLIWIGGLILSIPTFMVNDIRMFKIKSNNQTLYTTCEEIWFRNSFKYLYSILMIIIQYLVPLIIVSTTNCRICNFLYSKVPSIYSYSFKRKTNKNNICLNDGSRRKEKRKMSNKKSSLREKSEANESYEAETTIYMENEGKNIYCSEGKIVMQDNDRFNRSKRLLLTVCLSFALCWLPLLILNLFLDFFGMHVAWEPLFPLPALFLVGQLIAMMSCCINPVVYGLFNSNFREEFSRIYISFLRPKTFL